MATFQRPSVGDTPSAEPVADDAVEDDQPSEARTRWAAPRSQRVGEQRAESERPGTQSELTERERRNASVMAGLDAKERTGFS